MPTTRFELTITAAGVCRDADGNLLNPDGTIADEQPAAPQEDETAKVES